MWQAYVTKKAYGNGEIILTVGFADGPVTLKPETGDLLVDPDAPARVVIEQYRTRQAAADWLQKSVGARLRELEDLDVLVNSIQVGPLAVSATVKAPPTPKELAQQELQRALQEYARLEALVNAGGTGNLAQAKAAVAAKQAALEAIK